MRRLSIWMGTATAALLLAPLSSAYAADSAASSPQSVPSVAASCPGAAETSAAMQRMQSMHEQMAAAKTPAQRRAIGVQLLDSARFQLGSERGCDYDFATTR